MKKIIVFVKKYWWVAIVILAIFGKKIYQWWKTRPKGTEKTADANKILAKLSLTETAKARLNSFALQIAEKLGTAYEWYDPRRWTESDKEVFEILEGINQNDFNVIADLYFKVYAKGNTLSVDLAKYLDKKYYALLKIK